MPVPLPSGVKIDIRGSEITVTGSRGTLSRAIHQEMSVREDNGELLVSRPSDSRQHRALHGLTRALINNMVVGVSEGFTRRLRIEGVGYRAEMDGTKLVLNVGYSHPVVFDPPEDMSFTVEDRGKTITVSGIDKQVVGEVSANIRKTRPPEPYKGKGIRYADEHIRRKAGKAGKI
jgi:large subunit ribosomal protein L6